MWKCLSLLTFADVTTLGACAGSYSVTRTWTAKDACNNTSTASQTINVQDVTAPVINIVASNLTVECDGDGNDSQLQLWLNNNGGASASDLCSNVTWSNNYSALSNGCGATGSATVTFTATDECGNTVPTTATFIVKDNTKPVFNGNLPADVTVQCDAVPTPVVLTASDTCDNNVSVIYSESFSGQNDNCANTYTITRNWSVTDCAENNTQHTQIVNVIDTTKPVFNGNLPANVTVQCDAVPTPVVLTASDTCDNNVVVVYSESFSGQNDNCANTYTITRNWSVTDCAENNTQHTQIVNVIDTTKPVFNGNLPANVTVQCDAVPTPVVLTASDTCDNNVVVVYSESFEGQNDNCANTYTITRNWSVTDCAGNNNQQYTNRKCN